MKHLFTKTNAKKLLLGISGIILCGSLAVAQNKDLPILKTGVAITIDGTAEAAWDAVPYIEINNWGKDKTVPTANDFAASYKLLWDENYVYFLGKIVDDVLMDKEACATATAPDWEVDNFEIYWSPGNSKLENSSQMTQVRLAYANSTNDDPIATTKNGYSGGGFAISEFVKAARGATDDGYIVEASFDLKVSATAAGKTSFAAGDTIGFNAVACDNDGEAKRKNIGGVIDGFKWDQADTLIRLVLDATSYVKIPTQNHFQVYPSVASNVLKFTNVNEISNVTISNLQGQVVMRLSKPSETINITALKSGIYVVNIKGNSGISINQKFIKR